MAEVLHNNLAEIEASDIHQRLGRMLSPSKQEKGKYILLSAHREENIDTEKNFLSLFNAINRMAENRRQAECKVKLASTFPRREGGNAKRNYDMPILCAA